MYSVLTLAIFKVCWGCYNEISYSGVVVQKYLRLLVKSRGFLVGTATALIGLGSLITENQDKTTPVDPSKLDQAQRDLSPSQSQRDNHVQPHRTCNSTANAMYLNYFRLFNEDVDRQGYVPDDTYLSSVLKRGDTTDHEVQTRTLRAYGLDSVWDTSGSFSKMIRTLDEGFPIVVNLLHRGKVGNCGAGALRGGHVVLVRSYYTNTAGQIVFRVSDPYGQICSDYKDHKLDYDLAEVQFKARWQGGARYTVGLEKRVVN